MCDQNEAKFPSIRILLLALFSYALLFGLRPIKMIAKACCELWYYFTKEK